MRDGRQNLTGRTSGGSETAQRNPRRRRLWLVGAAPAALVLLALATSCDRDPLAPEEPRESVSALAICGGGDADGYVWHWAPCTSGSPAVSYEVQVRPRGEEWQGACKTDTTAVEIKSADEHQVRVRGVDASGRPGGWSSPSEWSGELVES